MTAPRTYYVYILTNAWNTVYYVGVTSDLAQRMAEHKTGAVEGFTDRYHVHKLVHVEAFAEVHEALAREKRLKRWRRDWKTALVETHNPDFRDLWTEDARPF